MESDPSSTHASNGTRSSQGLLKEYGASLRKRPAAKDADVERQVEEDRYRRFEAELGDKQSRKYRKKNQKRAGFLSCNRKFKDRLFYTKPHDQDIPREGPQLFLEEKFSENLYDKIVKGLIDTLNGGDHDLPVPTLEVQSLTTKINEAWTQLLDLVKAKNEAVAGYNARLKRRIGHDTNGAEVPRQNGHSSDKTKLLASTGSKNAESAETQQTNRKHREAQEEPLETQVLDRTLAVNRDIEKDMKNQYSYINCDVRYFNFDFLTSHLGYFDVLVVDPPWRIKGGQKNDSQYMFSNSNFCLEYNTMSNSEIMNLPIEKLSKKGFIFLWILANQVDSCIDILNKWGYQMIDMIVWVKIKDGKVWYSHGYYLMHSYEICLVGYKCPPKEHVEFYSKVSNNLIFAEIRAKSQKPDELYEMIDLMMPGSKKIEIFARNNNVRAGWFALGNQLGPQFDKWKNLVNCNNCDKLLDAAAKKRYKARKVPNFDLCDTCFSEGKDRREEEFFVLSTTIDEDILHYYHSCNMCKTEPIWGVRYISCHDPDYSLCESTPESDPACYDRDLELKKQDSIVYKERFEAMEVPEVAGGLPAHQKKCSNCYQFPIIGTCFQCSECKGFNLCQNCFFSESSLARMNRRTHKADHQMEMFLYPVADLKEVYNCSWCDRSVSTVYKCDNCHSFVFCEACYMKREHWTPLRQATGHKLFHNKFTKLN